MSNRFYIVEIMYLDIDGYFKENDREQRLGSHFYYGSYFLR